MVISDRSRKMVKVGGEGEGRRKWKGPEGVLGQIFYGYAPLKTENGP